MATIGDYRGTIAIHIHGHATNITAAGIVHGGMGHRTENGIITKEVAPRFRSLEHTGYKPTGRSGSVQGTTCETRSQVIDGQSSESETSSPENSAPSIESETRSQVRSAQGIESETRSHVKSTQSITKETSKAGCAHDAVPRSLVERRQHIETETAKLGSAEDGRQESPAGEETGLPLRTVPAPGEETRLPLGTVAGRGCGRGTVHSKDGGAAAEPARTDGCRKETRGAKRYQQAMKNSDKRQKDNNFHGACKEGDLARVVRILSEDVDNLNRKDSDGRTGLMVAAYQGHRDVVELLVTKGADLTLVDKGGDTVLHAACRAGDINIVKCVLSPDELDVNSSDRSGMTPAMSAARWGYVDVVKLLLRRGAKMQLVDDEGDTVLHYACRGGHEDVVECVVSADNTVVSARNRKGKTALQVAKELGHHVVYERFKSVDSGCYLM